VWNLLMNAVKFTPKGGRVDVLLRRTDTRAEIVVTDTGEGISKELLPYVFDRFRQGDSTSTRTHGGLGIGLALVRHLVDLHGGDVRAASEGVGRGASFIVTLPLASEQAESRARLDSSAASVATTATTTLRDVHVLLVDDDPDSLDLSRVVLESAGADIRTCTSGQLTTQTLTGWTPDVLVLDIEMPGENGYALLRRLRRSLLDEATPAIALTAYATAEDRKRAFAAGFNLHVAKPVDHAELIAAIATLSGRRLA